MIRRQTKVFAVTCDASRCCWAGSEDAAHAHLRNSPSNCSRNSPHPDATSTGFTMGLKPRTKSRPPSLFWGGILGGTRTETDNKNALLTCFLLGCGTGGLGGAPGRLRSLRTCVHAESQMSAFMSGVPSFVAAAAHRDVAPPPPGPVHSLKPNGFSGLVPNVATHGCHPRPQPSSRPPPPALDSWGRPPRPATS